MKTKKSGNNIYIESKISYGGAIRVSFIKQGWTEENCIRINKVQPNGKVFPGAEIPIENIDEVVTAIVQLIRENSNT